MNVAAAAANLISRSPHIIIYLQTGLHLLASPYMSQANSTPAANSVTRALLLASISSSLFARQSGARTMLITSASHHDRRRRDGKVKGRPAVLRQCQRNCPR
jgi:hypothetical protein